MKKNQIQSIVAHIVKDADRPPLLESVSRFHSEIIDRRLNASSLTVEQKIMVVDRVIQNLKSREVGGVIK